MALRKKYMGQEGKIYRALSTTAYVGIFVAAGIIVASLVNPTFALNATLWGIIFTIGVICLGLISVLPWVRKLEKGEYKKLSLIFIVFVAVCVILWLICVWLVITMINSQNPDNIVWLLWFIKVTLLVSLQLMVATVAGNLWTKCRNTMIPFQVVTYASYGFVDFYFSYLLFCVNINPTNTANPISLDTNALGALGTSFMITVLAIALVYMSISNFIIKRMEARRLVNMAADNFEEMLADQKEELQKVVDEKNAQPSATGKTMEEELNGLKDMLDKGVLTQEEYDEARKNVIAKHTK